MQMIKAFSFVRPRLKTNKQQNNKQTRNSTVCDSAHLVLAVVGYRSFFYRVLVDSFTVFAYSYMRQLELIRLNACAAAI